MKRAGPESIAILVRFMAESYAGADYTLDVPFAEKAFSTLLADERLGYVWLLEDEGRDAGYVVLTLRFGMEYGGMMACLDDLYVVPSSRNRGLSTRALQHIAEFCQSVGIRAITVEVGHSNGPAQTVYRRVGLVEVPDRQLLVLALASPSHVV